MNSVTKTTNALSALKAGLTRAPVKLPLALLLASQAHCVWATQGTMPHGYGVKSEGMGGVVMRNNFV